MLEQPTGRQRHDVRPGGGDVGRMLGDLQAVVGGGLVGGQPAAEGGTGVGTRYKVVPGGVGSGGPVGYLGWPKWPYSMAVGVLSLGRRTRWRDGVPAGLSDTLLAITSHFHVFFTRDQVDKNHMV